MKLVRWLRFAWDLSTLPPAEAAVAGRMAVRLARREEEEAVAEVIQRTFLTDSVWSDVLKALRPVLAGQIEAAFARAPAPVMVIAHGHRLIGASVLAAEAEAENHLLTGPCVLAEYRSRGLGTMLLQHSLLALKEYGVKRALGVTRESAAAGKFVYPKFGSVSAEYEFEPGLVGVR